MFALQLTQTTAAAGQLQLGRRTRNLALAVAAATMSMAPLFAAPAYAQAGSGQETCQPGGYWYLQKEGRGNALAMACPGGASFERVPAAAARASTFKRATNPQDCEPGGYWWMGTEEGPWTDVAMKCR